MPRYTDESRERVRDAVNFEELVGARTDLKRAGVGRLHGLCPFHEERTPSFGINPIEKVYHCFGCGAGGDVFRFVMDTEGLTFGEALETLAERYRVTLERETEDPHDAARRERRERLYALLERTAAYYVRVLWEAPEAASAREYLERRGLREDVLRAYRVGFAPDAFDRVLLGSQKAGFSQEELLAAGLIQHSRGRAGVMDRFRGRVTFPLTDAKGHVLGFGARAMKPDQQPKYLNTSDGEIFHKSQVVYGQDMARAAAAKAGRVVIVEGYTDVIALHQAGVPETVAQMGTALTEQQVDAIARLAPKALLCQDPDSAGQASAKRGLDALTALMKSDKWRTRSVEFKIVRLPTKQDPADVVQQAGAEEMVRLLQTAMPIERFEVERALEQEDASTDEVLAEAVRIIVPLPAERAARRVDQAHRRPPRHQPCSSWARCCAAPRRPLRLRKAAQGNGTAGATVEAVATAGATATAGSETAAASGTRTGAGEAAAIDSAVPDRRPSRSTRARCSPAANRARRPTSRTASRCPTRASGAWPRSTSTTTSPRSPAARPPSTFAPTCGILAGTSRAETRTSPAWWPS